MLKTGTKIAKKVTINNTNNLKFTIPMSINNQKIYYDVIVKLTCAKISFKPTSFNFGVIDEGVISAPRTLLLINDGHSMASFHIDITKTKGHVILEPTKGVVKAKSQVEIKVKVIPLSIGWLNYTLALKCDKIITVPITATVIIPRLEAIHPRASKLFTLIYFDPTYCGLKSSQYLMIRNYSATDCMFTTDGEHHDRSVQMEELHLQNPDVDYFNINPIDGVMEAQETKPFYITFAPIRRESKRKKLYYFCTLVIHKIRCKYLQKEVNFIGKDLYTKTPDTTCSYKGSLSSIATLCSLTLPSTEADTSCINDSETLSFYKSQEFTERDMIRIHLCGAVETPSVKITPDELRLPVMCMQGTETRVLELRNMSLNLPIILRYRRIPFVTLEQSTIHLEATKAKEVIVTITPYKLGTIRSKIMFEMLYYDLPKKDEPKVIGEVSVNIIFTVRSATSFAKPNINKKLDPNYIKEVGINCQELRFNSSFNNVKAVIVDKKRLDHNCTDLVALPNDKQRSLRPWRSKTACCTIFAKQPRYVPPLDTSYERTQSEIDFRNKNQGYYNKYISLQWKKRKIENDDYTITPKKELLCLGLENVVQEVDIKLCHKCKEFIPLTPTQMKNIFAVPQCIKPGAIAANHNLVFPLRIHNMNDFSVRLYIKSDKGNIGCIRENRYILSSHSYVEVKLVYNSGTVGYYAAVIDLIFNESMTIPVPILVNVIPKILRLNTLQVVFPDGCTQQYIEITNELNIAVKFSWFCDYANFTIQPSDGTVNIGCTLKCVIYYSPEIEGPTTCTVKFASGDCSPQLVTITSGQFNRKLELITKDMNFENITLQTTAFKFPLIKNLCDFSVGFTVDRSNLKPNWIQVAPMGGVLKPNSIFCLLVTILSPICVTFRGTLKITVVNEPDKKYEISVTGNVVYPDISINPSILAFPKIPSSAFAIIKFTITNQCTAETYVDFDLEEYPEFKITETGRIFDKNFIKSVVFLSRETKSFYIHFYPTEAMSTWFYLPIVINGILGPPLRYDTITQMVDYYLVSDTELDDNSKLTAIPQKIPCIKVTSFSVEPSIIFSKKVINLSVDELNEKSSYILRMKNPHHKQKTLVIKLSSVDEPFTYYINMSHKWTELRNGECVMINLGPQREKEIMINYEPDESGVSRVFLPVYIRTNETNQLHTALEIVGTLEQAKIEFCPLEVNLSGCVSGRAMKKMVINTVDKYRIYCRPLPTDITTVSVRLAIFKNHKKTCEVKMGYDGDDLTLHQGSEPIWISDTDYKMDIKIVNLPNETCNYKGIASISCSCGGLWKREAIGVYENSFLTTYPFSEMYLKVELNRVPPSVRALSSTLVMSKGVEPESEHPIAEFWHLFPLFPTQCTDFTSFMDGCVHATEMWLYTQGFFCETFHHIPRCVSDVYTSEVQDKNKRNTKTVVNMPMVQLLNNLIGPKIYKYLGSAEYPKVEIEQACYLHTTYKSIMDLIVKHGGIFSYCAPVCYLPYNYFELYIKDFKSEDTPLTSIVEWVESIDDFYLLSKQAWLDILLQTYKAFYLFRLPIEKCQTTPDIKPLNDFYTALPQLALENTHMHSLHEQVIIAWFQYHYDNTSLWDNKTLPVKVISITGECFADGLAFASIICAYCPYLTQHLQGMFIDPETSEEYIHNILTIIQALEFLNYSFSIVVHDILRPNSLRILMIMAYLYDILPSMYPSETMTFEIGLSNKITKSIILTNTNQYQIAYKPVLIPANTSFLLSSNKLVIPPQKNIELKITYVAKFAKPINCTLLLSGEVPKYHYARNKCLTLIGIPDLSYPSTTITHPSYLFEITNINISIETPYAKSGVYEVRQAIEPIQTYEELRALPVYTPASRFSVSRVALKNDTFASDAKGVLPLTGIIRNVLACDSTNCFYFSSPNIGDFMLQIETKWSETVSGEDIIVPLPAEYSDNVKLYVERKKLVIKIPLVNKTFWNAIKTITCDLVDEEDKNMWDNILDFPAGRLIASNLYRVSTYIATQIDSDNDVSICYDIITDNKCNIVLPEQVTIRNEYEDGVVDIEWEPKSLTDPLPDDFVMTLKNDEFSLLRRYNIIFRY